MIFPNFFRGKLHFSQHFGGKFSAEFSTKFSPEKNVRKIDPWSPWLEPMSSSREKVDQKMQTARSLCTGNEDVPAAKDNQGLF
jgi:hypothetical protein